MVIAIDFDGTVVTHEYPKIGEDIGAVPVLKKIIEKGHKLILHTMRSGKEEEEAMKWFEEREIPIYGINDNPSQHRWTSSKKVFANLYIDDTALGAPLTSSDISGRPYIDWTKVEQLLKSYGVL
jgi:hypothetical protein